MANLNGKGERIREACDRAWTGLDGGQDERTGIQTRQGLRPSAVERAPRRQARCS
jgi:hypothetical protein